MFYEGSIMTSRKEVELAGGGVCLHDVELGHGGSLAPLERGLQVEGRGPYLHEAVHGGREQEVVVGVDREGRDLRAVLLLVVHHRRELARVQGVDPALDVAHNDALLVGVVDYACQRVADLLALGDTRAVRRQKGVTDAQVPIIRVGKKQNKIVMSDQTMQSVCARLPFCFGRETTGTDDVPGVEEN